MVLPGYNAHMASRGSRPSLTSFVAFALIAALYVMSYYITARIEHSEMTGNAEAEYPEFVKPVSILFRPMETVDSRVRADLWAPVIPANYGDPQWMDRGY